MQHVLRFKVVKSEQAFKTVAAAPSASDQPPGEPAPSVDREMQRVYLSPVRDDDECSPAKIIGDSFSGFPTGTIIVETPVDNASERFEFGKEYYLSFDEVK